MNTSFSKKKETESKHWPCNDILSTPGRLYYSLLYYGSGVKRPFWPHRRILVTRWSRYGPPSFRVQYCQNLWIWMLYDAIFLYLVVEELNSSKPNQLQKGVASPHVSPSVQLIQTLLRLIFVRESTAAGSGYETCIQSALQHFQHCFLIPLAWIEFGSEFCGVGVGLIWIDAHPQIKWLRERSPGLPTW